ncbi:phosphofurin acidic cluster sorting protein 1-like isoform X3 [Scylla paramamosain]|uniref:phosphofurin acidic cluster sorting protein 1-like isoform X3 n=1 Tax=Scylla paramamosain TaxID=85552 RepID=UPI003082BA48
MVTLLCEASGNNAPTMAGGFPRSCSWSVTPATPPVATLSPPELPPQAREGGHRSRCYNDIFEKRASVSMVMSALRSPTRPETHIPRADRSPRRSLGAVWRVSSSSPARQLGAWLGRRPRSFAGTEDTGASLYISGQTLAPPTSPVPSLCSSSPELPSPLDVSGGQHPYGGSASTAACLSSSPSATSLAALTKTIAPRRPTRLVISGRARPRRPYHTPCVTRLCNVTVTRLQVTLPLGGDLNSVTLAVKMQSSKRTLRSNEIPVPPSGTLDTELQLTFSLQYPHFLKREGNTLQIMLQRRKKYKNRAFLGFKTLAVGIINMSQVLQRPVDRDLELYSEGKEKGSPLAKVTMVSLSSQPVDTDEPGDRTKSFMADNPALAPLTALILRRLMQGTTQEGCSSLYPDNALGQLPFQPRMPALEDRSVDLVEVYSDDDEDYSSQDEGSDSEPILEGETRRSHHHHHHHHLRSNTRSKSLPPNARQRNLKQRFIALLKRFKVPEAFEQDQELDPRTGAEVDEAEIEDLFDELEGLSDSGPEVDTISITSTPKPSLRPYFSSSRSLLNEGGPYLRLKVPGALRPHGVKADKVGADRLSDESSKRADSDHMENWTDQEHSDPQCIASSPPRDDKNKRDRSNMSLKERKSISSTGGSTPRQEKTAVERSNSSANVDSSPRKVLLEQLARVLPVEDVQLPDHVILVNTAESHGPLLAAHLTEHGHRVITTMALADVKATVSHLVNKLQKFCNSNLKAPGPMKVVVVGSDLYISCVLRPYVDQFSSKPPDFQNHIRFLIIPLGVNSLAKYLGSIDSTYGAAFVSESWREVIERWEKPDVQEVVNRVHRYLTQAQQTLHLPIAEAMLTYKEKSGDDESSQAFVPFIMDVRLGSGDVTSTSVDLEDTITAPAAVILPGSPPAASTPTSGLNIDKARENITPPSSPNINSSHLANYKILGESGWQEPLDLQVDYWLVRGSGREEKEKDKEKEKARIEGGKYTLKTSFRTLQVARLAPLGVTQPFDPSSCHHLTLSYATKEKKQRIMRLGKKKEKERETESRREVVDGVSRLLGSAKNQPFRVSIDSAEWTNVKFFQLSSQWQTQIKSFPISLFSLQDSNL